MIISPCISICKTDPCTGYCYGCGRTTKERKFGRLLKQLINGKRIILSKLKRGLLDGNQKVLKNPIHIKLKMVFLYLKKI